MTVAIKIDFFWNTRKRSQKDYKDGTKAYFSRT